MKLRKLAFAAFVAATIPSAASAGTGQCYNRFGTPIGPTYDTDKPNYSFLEWVKKNGGRCDRIGSSPTYAPAYPQYRPHNYPGGVPSFYSQPYQPSGVDNFGDVLRVDALLRQHYMNIGHSTVSALGLNQYVSIDGRGWRLFRVYWFPEHYEYVAVRRQRGGNYIGRKYFGSSNWSSVVYLGR